jgi:EAL domain-containing protein (putative c-di-GMP-specific phosphodiesterase class I)
VDGGSDGANLPVPVGGPSSLSPVDGAPVSPEHVNQALQEDLFLLYCQPVVDLRTSDVAQYELLLRMSDEEGNLILPRAFLQTAEESGLMRSIDHWVVRRAIRLIAEGARSGKHVRLEVNLAGSSVDDPDLPGVVEQELITTGADPSSLVLEVPEAVATQRHEEVKDLAKRLRALGCRFAVDNFGSAVTSFRYIKDLPLDFLKLDGDLIATLPESRTDQLVVKAIVDIARGMGCETIAEMVADDETLFLLRQQGVGYAQGYQVGRPQPVSEI